MLVNRIKHLFLDVKVFAKKEIPLRTKFGPVEGDIQLIDADQLKHSTLPSYFIDESTYIDTSNERKKKIIV